MVEFNNYIGVKLVKAKPMTRGEYNNYRGWEAPKGEDQTIDGYLVVQGAYETWVPGCVFDKYYINLSEHKGNKEDVTINSETVVSFIKEKHIETIGDKTTLVRVVLVNGFEIIETSSCVSKENYDQQLGADICMNKIIDKIWDYLGFLLNTAYRGVK